LEAAGNKKEVKKPASKKPTDPKKAVLK